MKSFLLFVYIISLLSISNLYSQDIEAKLKGHLAVNGFTVVDDNGKVLFRVTGEGNIGINTENPTALFDIQGGLSTNSVGRDINIIAESGDYYDGGNVLIRSGYAELPLSLGEILIEGGKTDEVAGCINIYSGFGGQIGGDINIISSIAGLYNKYDRKNPILNSNLSPDILLSQEKAGDINIGTGFSNMEGGKISIYTTGSNWGGDDILIEAGPSNGAGNKLVLSTNYSSGGDGDIVLEAGIGANGEGGEDIILTPNSRGGLVIVNGSGTYSGNWTQSSDEIFKKKIELIQNAVDKIEQLNGVSYELKSEEFPEKNFEEGRQIGLIAQEVETVFPELVRTDSEGYKSIAYQNMVAVLVEAVKEQQKSIDELKKEMEELKISQGNEISTNTNYNN